MILNWKILIFVEVEVKAILIKIILNYLTNLLLSTINHQILEFIVFICKPMQNMLKYEEKQNKNMYMYI